MSATSTSTDQLIPRSNHQDRWEDFVRWAIAQLGLDLQQQAGHPTLTVPEEDRKAFDGKATLQLSFDGQAEDSQRESTAPDSRLANWLLAKLQESAPPTSTRPVDQPASVNDVVSRLFKAYRVDRGQVHLGGCQLTDMPFLRLTYADSSANGTLSVCHFFVAHDGTSVSDELIERLGLLHLEPVLELPPRIDETSLAALESAARRIAAQSCSSRDPAANVVDPLAVALVWIKQASGKLQFTIGDSTVELPFSGWAKLVEAPPYVSSSSGASSYHLAATDDGEIEVASEIVQCEHSGRRVTKQNLVECSVSGAKVESSLVRQCPVSGQLALEQFFRACASCGEDVAENVLKSGVCEACRSMTKAAKSDPRLVWILSEHKGLETWRWWKLAETESVYIAEASNLTSKLLLVIDKESLAIRRLARAGRFSSRWVPVPEMEWPQFLD